MIFGHKYSNLLKIKCEMAIFVSNIRNSGGLEWQKEQPMKKWKKDSGIYRKNMMNINNKR